MGGPKALLRTAAGGPTLVETGIRALLGGGCNGVTVVVGASADEVRLLADRVGAGADVEVVDCPDWREGMGASLRAGLAAVGPRAVDAVVVTLVDLPDVGVPVVRRLVAAVREAGPWRTALARAAYGGVPGHPALIGRTHWSAVVATATGDRGARDHFATTPHLLVEVGDLGTGRDVDTPADLHRLE